MSRGPEDPGVPVVPVAIGATLLGGALFALQSRLNGELADRAGSALWAAVLSFGSGLVVVAALVAALPAGRRWRSASAWSGRWWWRTCCGASRRRCPGWRA